MRWLSWQRGRQVANYAKLLLFETFHFDAYLLYYPSEAYLPVHTDIVPGYYHYRCNIILREPKIGGDFSCDYPILIFKRIKIFRSDEPHSMTCIDKGRRVVLSLGFIKKRGITTK